MLDVLLAGAIAVNQVEPNWVVISDSVVETLYYDANSFRGKGNYRTVSLLKTSKIGEETLRPTVYVECKSKTTGLVTNMIGNDIRKLDRSRLKYPDPGSVAEYMVNLVCPMIKK